MIVSIEMHVVSKLFTLTHTTKDLQDEAVIQSVKEEEKKNPLAAYIVEWNWGGSTVSIVLWLADGRSTWLSK